MCQEQCSGLGGRGVPTSRSLEAEDGVFSDVFCSTAINTEMVGESQALL